MTDRVNTWLAKQLGNCGIHSAALEDHHPADVACLKICLSDWTPAAEEAKRLGTRLVAVWAAESGGADEHDGLYAYMALAHPLYRHALLRTRLYGDAPAIDSISSHFIAASRMERQMQEMFGLHVRNAPDGRLWIKHEHWPPDAHPLKRDFPARQAMPVHEGGDYDYVRSGSESVYEIPVGPVHAGIIEPGHFRFLAVGEKILNMEERLGYVHKGIERAMQGRTAEAGIQLAARVSGDSTVAHAWAFAQACEHASGVNIPERACLIRAILCERERMANHISDIGAICNDAAFGFLHAQMQRLREEMARLHYQLFEHRLLMDTIVPGGVSVDLDTAGAQSLQAQTEALAKEVEALRDIYADHPSIQERVVGSGVVSVEDARDIGLLGFAGRASGHYADARIEAPYPPYGRLAVGIGIARGEVGDVATRVWVRFEEIADAARLIGAAIDRLRAGEVRIVWRPPKTPASGYAAIEGWRGEIAAWVRFDADGRIDRYVVRDPSVINWLGLELAVREVPVPDFPLNNKSFNCSYSGNDL